MSLKLSQIPVVASSLAPTDVLYMAADAGGGFFLEERLPVSVIGTSAFRAEAIGVVPTDTLWLPNSTPATLGLQQFSPSIRFDSAGFATTPAESQPTFWRIYNTPVQGAANPSTSLIFSSSVNNGAIAARLTLTHLGQLFTQTSVNAGSNVNATLAVNAGTSINATTFVTVPAAGQFAFLTRGMIGASADGVFSLFNAAGTDFSRLTLGGVTSSFPAIGRSGNILEVLGADGASMADFAVYNTKTSTVSFERLDIFWTANVAQLWTEKGSGGGTARALVLGADGTELLRFGSATTLSFFAVAPVARQVVPTGSSTDTVITALQNLGLFSQT